MDAKTQKAELTRAAIVGAALDLAAAEGLESITLQAVADRVGLSKSGVFSRAGSREALQKAVIEEFGRRFLADVFVPAMQQPKGLPRLDEIVRRWIARELSPLSRLRRFAEEAEIAVRNLARLAQDPPVPTAVAVAEAPREAPRFLWFALGALVAGLAFLAGAAIS